MECIWSAETGFGSHPDHKHSRPPSSTVRDVLSTVSARAGNRSVRVSWYARFTRVWSSNSSAQLRRTRTSSTVSLGADHCSGPRTIGRFGANTSGDDYTPHRAEKDTKSSGSPGLSTATTLRPNSAISLKQTFNCILYRFCNRQYFGVQKTKNGDWGTIVYSAALRVSYTRYGLLS